MSELFLWDFYLPNAFIITFLSFIEKFCLGSEYDYFEFTDFSNVAIFKNWHLSTMYNLLIHKNDIHLAFFLFLCISFHYCLVTLFKRIELTFYQVYSQELYTSGCHFKQLSLILMMFWLIFLDFVREIQCCQTIMIVLPFPPTISVPLHHFS